MAIIHYTPASLDDVVDITTPSGFHIMGAMGLDGTFSIRIEHNDGSWDWTYASEGHDENILVINIIPPTNDDEE